MFYSDSEHLGIEHPRTIEKGPRKGEQCPPGHAFCWQCGHVDTVEEFKKAYCPNSSCLMMSSLGQEREIIVKGQRNTGKKCPPGKDFCWICGTVADPIDFLKAGCPSNPNHMWND